MSSSVIRKGTSPLKFVNKSTGSYNLDDYSGFNTLFVERGVDTRTNDGAAMPLTVTRLAFGNGQIQFASGTASLYYRVKWGSTYSDWMPLVNPRHVAKWGQFTGGTSGAIVSAANVQADWYDGSEVAEFRAVIDTNAAANAGSSYKLYTFNTSTSGYIVPVIGGPWFKPITLIDSNHNYTGHFGYVRGDDNSIYLSPSVNIASGARLYCNFISRYRVI